MKKNLIIKKSISSVALFAFMVGSFSLGFTPLVQASNPNWNVSGSYNVEMKSNEISNSHNVSLEQDSSGNLSGSGASLIGVDTYAWIVKSGSVDGDAINIVANYTATPDAITPQTVLNLNGHIAIDGSISGVWSDNYQGGSRSGSFLTTKGNAVVLEQVPVNVTTNIATSVTSNDAMLNGTNGGNAGIGHSFWVSLAPFETTDVAMPANVYSTVDLGALASNATFAASLSSVMGLPMITANTPYYFAAWSNIAGTWYPGAVQTFTTAMTSTDGVISGDVTGGATVGILGVTSVETVSSSAIADGTFGRGWKYIFNITIPTNETHLAMKFADWSLTGGSSIIPAANNVRISSTQASNSNATILITAANTYSAPTLNMTGDLNPSLDGMQVKVMVETSIPLNSTNGTYTTSYGVKTL